MSFDFRRGAWQIAALGRVGGRTLAADRSAEIQAALQAAGNLIGRRSPSGQAKQLLAPRLAPDPKWEEIEQNAQALVRDLASTLAAGDAVPDLDPVELVSLKYAEALMRQEEAVQRLQAVNPEEAPLHSSLQGLERERVEEFVAAACSVGWRFIVLDKALESWERFSASIGEGGWMREEFENALDGRDRLHWFRELIISDVRQTLDLRLDTADSRYLEATVETERAQYACGKRDGGWQWWWWRKPKAGYE